jgi:hypothetical protein
MMDEDSDNEYVTADEEEVCYLAYQELNLSIFLKPTWDFPTFDHFVPLAVRWSFFDRHLFDPTSMEYDEEYAKLILYWSMVT